MAIEWFVSQGDRAEGPISSSHLKLMADQGEIAPETLVKLGAGGQWVRADTIEDLFSTSGPVGHASQSQAAPPTPHSGEPPLPPESPPVKPDLAHPPATSPPAPPDAPSPDETICWYAQMPDGRQHGPVAKAQLDEWVAQEHINARCMVWRQGWETWKWVVDVYPQLAQPPQEAGTADKPGAAPEQGAEPNSLVGQLLGRYEILELLGQGRLGAVFKARQPRLDRLLAVRVLQGSQDPLFLERFRGQLRMVAALVHPNIVEIHDLGQDRGYLYIAMEFVEGGSLADVLKARGRLEPDRAPRIMEQAAAALAEAHSHGVIHRDVKPSNILLDRGDRAKLSDFGLTACGQGDPDSVQGGPVPPTALYVSPEIVRGRPPDERSDLYSLGATFYHLLAGQPPLAGASDLDIAQKHLHTQPHPLAEVAPAVPPSLCQIVDRLLSKDPAARYSSAAELRAALEGAAISGDVPPPSSASLAEELPASGGPRTARKGLVAALLIGLAAAALALFLVSRGCSPSPGEAELGSEAPFPPGGWMRY